MRFPSCTFQPLASPGLARPDHSPQNARLHQLAANRMNRGQPYAVRCNKHLTLDYQLCAAAVLLCGTGRTRTALCDRNSAQDRRHGLAAGDNGPHDNEQSL